MAIRKRFYTKQETNASFPGFPTYVEKSSNTGRKVLFLVVIMIIIAVIVLAGLYFLGQSRLKNFSFAPARPTPTQAPVTPTTQPTPTPKLLRKDLSITVLNGSGTKGAASVMADYLTGLGYTVAKTGNADSFDYTKTTVQVAKDKSQYLSMLKDDLAKQKNAGEIDASVSADLSSGAEVIVSK